MSFEGYWQVICGNDHYHELEYENGEEDYKPDFFDCPVCQAKAKWRNLVNDTNCDEQGKVPVLSLLENMAVPKKPGQGFKRPQQLLGNVILIVQKIGGARLTETVFKQPAPECGEWLDQNKKGC